MLFILSRILVKIEQINNFKGVNMTDYEVVEIKDGNVYSVFGTNKFCESLKQFKDNQKIEPSVGFKYPKKY